MGSGGERLCSIRLIIALHEKEKQINNLPQIEVFLQRYRPLTHISVATATILQNEMMKLSNENLAVFFMEMQYILSKIDSLSLQIWV